MQKNQLRALKLHYAEEIRLSGGILSEQVIEVFASVPRERFLGPGPWEVPLCGRHLGDAWSYRSTCDDNPKHLYHNTLIAIDSSRGLHNGLPSFLAFKIEAARISNTDRVVHIGCGVGYYTAIMAELALIGNVTAIESDEILATKSKENLAHWENVEVVSGDGAIYDPGEADVFFVNAGVTRISRIWLDRLAISGRLLLPITHKSKGDNFGNGIVLLIERQQDGQLSARSLCGVSIFDCIGSRSAQSNRNLGVALARQDSNQIRSLKFSDHPFGKDCWVHLDGICISKKDIT